MIQLILSFLKYIWRYVVFAILLGLLIWVINFSRSAASAMDPATGTFVGSNSATRIVEKAQSKLDDFVEDIIDNALG